MNLSAVTPVILTYNEAPNIARVLDRLQWAGRVVVVDSFSTDETLSVAKRYPNTVTFQRRFDDHASQWNFGLDQAETEWVLSLDADYVVPEACLNEWAAVDGPENVAAFEIPFRYCVRGTPLRGSLYPPRVALFRRALSRYAQDGHTQRLRVNGITARLRAPILHDDRKSLRAWLHAQSRYAALEADKLIATPRSRLSRIERLRRTAWIGPLATPAYCLVGKGLLLDGWRGWAYTLQRTYAETLIALELLERRFRGSSSEHA